MFWRRRRAAAERSRRPADHGWQSNVLVYIYIYICTYSFSRWP